MVCIFFCLAFFTKYSIFYFYSLCICLYFCHEQSWLKVFVSSLVLKMYLWSFWLYTWDKITGSNNKVIVAFKQWPHYFSKKLHGHKPSWWFRFLYILTNLECPCFYIYVILVDWKVVFHFKWFDNCYCICFSLGTFYILFGRYVSSGTLPRF